MALGLKMIQTKKKREREILDEVYADRGPADIEPHEAPDFLVQLHPSSKRFGVEVTEFYMSEAEARLRRIDAYVTDLLDGADFRHKDDRQHFKVTKVDILSQHGEIKAKELPAIVFEVPPRSHYAARVAEIIRKKDQSLSSVPRDMTHVNLIVRDRTNMLRHRPSSDFYALFCTEELQRSVFESTFREIYFVTMFKSGEAYIPLKVLMTVAHIYLLDFYWKGYKKRFDTANDFMRWFAHYLCTLTAGDVRIRDNGQEVEVLHGGTGFLIRGDSGLVLRDYRDYALS